MESFPRFDQDTVCLRRKLRQSCHEVGPVHRERRKWGPGVQAITGEPRQEVQVKVGDGLLRRRATRVQQVEPGGAKAGAVPKAELLHNRHELCHVLAVDVPQRLVMHLWHDEGVAVGIELTWQETEHRIVRIDDVGVPGAVGNGAEGTAFKRWLHALTAFPGFRAVPGHRLI